MPRSTEQTAADRFVEKWSAVELSERAASHEHFIDLCRLIGQPTPASADSTGDEYTFEKAVKVVGVASKGSKGEGGYVDVWKRGCFGWEYKRKDKYKSLDEAYRQLYQYRDALENPPLSCTNEAVQNGLSPKEVSGDYIIDRTIAAYSDCATRARDSSAKLSLS